MSDRELFTLWGAFKVSGLQFRQLIVWVKDRFTLGHADFQYATEPAIYGVSEGKYDKDSVDDEGDGQVALYARGNGKFQNNRKFSNTWFFEKPLSSKDHPTMKPVGLCAKGVLAMSEVGDIVFDPFSGSGSTLIACEQTGRKCYGCEIDPKYCDVIRKRYWKFKTGSEEGWQDGTKAISA
ncbi:site-specific DNA-methyltransferase [Candidatus Saccharibacteria bacterium]|nr:site-specific DNA-methyltransferase [Candidatus Saccharibacteria bacterium]